MGGFIKVLAIGTLLLLLVSAGFYLAGWTTVATALATVTVMLWVLLILAAVWTAGSWWTAKTMERGADIALRAQQINDSWDARKTQAFGSVFSAGVKVARDNRPAGLPGDLPSLPLLPDQADDWLPPLESFNVDADYSEIEELE